ncbi:unnamed protein product [Lathyrus sativus]|nr:unnamed protein product [Lathyrus sativus]
MQTCGVSLESIQSEGHQFGKDGEAVNNASNSSEPSSVTHDAESHPQANIVTESIMEINEVVPSEPVNVCQVQEFPTSKRLKVSDTEEVKIIKLKATSSSIVEWLENLDEGATLTDMLEHFNGSNQDSIVELLNCLEFDFSIYKKGNVYKAM